MVTLRWVSLKILYEQQKLLYNVFAEISIEILYRKGASY
jgi:hypothetical protein